MSLVQTVLRNCLYLPGAVLLLSGPLQRAIPPSPQKHTVEIIQMKFRPAELLVRKGDTVVFLNKDRVTHDVTEAEKDWQSPPLAPGESWQRVMAQPATYFCSFHPVMKGSIKLK
ncbi:plastocyanin/azurin family copper-binding protein [Pontibacter roseus]|uniref:plastocyanin/azurin family copper-binding protein n=1 Tax=Pontibacter roseus TaxID=336989 RepID=UPI00037076C8|nr:plastocyanin/azurin family copper-binding protein [Pontibacter roseus]